LNDLAAYLERAVLIHIDFRSTELNEELDEFTELVSSSDILPVEIITCSRDVPNPRFFIGRGKISKIRSALEENNADIVIFNHAISPAQERNLERELKCRVVEIACL